MRFISPNNIFKISIFTILLISSYLFFINSTFKSSDGIKVSLDDENEFASKKKILNALTQSVNKLNQTDSTTTTTNTTKVTTTRSYQTLTNFSQTNTQPNKLISQFDSTSTTTTTSTTSTTVTTSSTTTGINYASTTTAINTTTSEKITTLNHLTSKHSTLNKKRDNLLCIIMTSSKTIEERCVAVWETWANECNQTILACNCKNTSFKSSSAKKLFDSMTFLELPIEENYNRMAQKVMLIVKLAFAKYGHRFNWFLLTDDDTFIFTPNLYKFMQSRSDSEPVTYGYNFKTIVPGGYHSGGAGVLFTHESLGRIHKKIVEEKCNFIDGYGDVALGECAHLADVKLGDSLDTLGRERFHPLDTYSHFHRNFPDWLFQYAANPVKGGIECCSNETISFHYERVPQMYALKRIKNIEEIKSV